MDQRPGAGLDARQRGARPRARAGGPLRLLLRPPPGRPHPPEALRRPEPRPHHPQGRPHRHRDHEPPDRAGVAAPVHPRPRGAPGGRAAPRRRRPRGRRARCSTSAAARFVVVRSRATLLAMGGGPTMYQVIACSADKSADGIALGLRAGAARCATWRWCSSIPTGLDRAQLAHDRRAARGGAARGGRPAPQRPRRALHGSATTPTRMERSTRDLVARACFTEVQEGRGTAERRRVDRRLAPGRGGGRDRASAAWCGAAATSAAIWPASRSRWGRPRTS